LLGSLLPCKRLAFRRAGEALPSAPEEVALPRAARHRPPPNNSLMLTRLAGERAGRVACQVVREWRCVARAAGRL